MNYHLFKLKCECDTVFDPDDNEKCPACQKSRVHHKELIFDIDKFLDMTYDLYANDKRQDAIDLVMDSFDNLYLNFNIMNDIEAKIDVSKIDGAIMCSILMMTFKYADKLPNHILLCDRISDRLREIGPPEYTEERIHNLIDRFRATGDYWKRMEGYGAPEWLTGPKPKE